MIELGITTFGEKQSLKKQTKAIHILRGFAN